MRRSLPALIVVGLLVLAAGMAPAKGRFRQPPDIPIGTWGGFSGSAIPYGYGDRVYGTPYGCDPSVLMGGTTMPGSFAPGFAAGQPVGQSRPIFGGSVTLVSAPTELRPGTATVVVAVEGGGAAQAQLSGYLYRPDDTTQGTPVRFTRQGNLLHGQLDVPATGQWELALRVNRPGYADERVYYTLMAQR
ncbi:MAG TPA: hypothetical protein DEP45_14515 [Armatimonadetes bacterium]|nr:hypothetical protein [Armatimonadota bacterium]